MNDERAKPQGPDDPFHIPQGLDRRFKKDKPTGDSEVSAGVEHKAVSDPSAEGAESSEDDDSAPPVQGDEAKLEAIAVKYDEIDKRSIEGKVRQGELLAEARKYLKEQKDWVRFVTKRLGTNLMDVHRKIRCHEAAMKVGANKLLQAKLSESAIWHLAAPDVPDEALWEAVEQAQSGPVSLSALRGSLFPLWQSANAFTGQSLSSVAVIQARYVQSASGTCLALGRMRVCSKQGVVELKKLIICHYEGSSVSCSHPLAERVHKLSRRKREGIPKG